MIITENGTYEVTGNQPVPGADRIDYEQICRGAGIEHVFTISSEADFDAHLDRHFTGEGPQVFIWKIKKASEPVPKPKRLIRERAHRLREALTQ